MSHSDRRGTPGRHLSMKSKRLVFQGLAQLEGVPAKSIKTMTYGTRQKRTESGLTPGSASPRQSHDLTRNDSQPNGVTTVAFRSRSTSNFPGRSLLSGRDCNAGRVCPPPRNGTSTNFHSGAAFETSERFKGLKKVLTGRVLRIGPQRKLIQTFTSGAFASTDRNREI